MIGSLLKKKDLIVPRILSFVFNFSLTQAIFLKILISSSKISNNVCNFEKLHTYNNNNELEGLSRSTSHKQLLFDFCRGQHTNFVIFFLLLIDAFSLSQSSIYLLCKGPRFHSFSVFFPHNYKETIFPYFHYYDNLIIYSIFHEHFLLNYIILIE